MMIAMLLVMAIIGSFAFWVFKQDKGVLFAGLSAQDASAMVAELDRMKVPYQLDHDGGTILVAAPDVHKTRLQILGKDIPLHGTVGFELFNNSDFGMTEFAQKVNYQRALQGEITRTILAIDVIEAARVHLALPEQGLFKRAGAQPKASVTLTVKPGQQLSTDQVRGIQRLVSASVAEIRVEDVTVLDQHGVALSKASGAAGNDLLGSDLLDRKRAQEAYLTKKLDEVLTRSFGADKAIASVDVEFNDRTIKQTTEDISPSDNERGTGVVIRERQTARSSGAGDAQDAEGAPLQSEYDYQVGRRVEQVERGPGGTERISVAVVLRTPMADEDVLRLKDIVANTVGLVVSRGDSVAVYSMAELAQGAEPGRLVDVPAVSTQHDEVSELVAAPATKQAPSTSVPAFNWLWLALALAIALLVLVLRSLYSKSATTPAVPRMTEQEREQALLQVRAWLAQSSESGGGRPL